MVTPVTILCPKLKTDVKITDFFDIFDKVSVNISCSKLKFDVKFTANTHRF